MSEDLQSRPNRITLHIFLVLSFVSTGFYFLSEFLQGLFLPAMSQVVKEYMDAGVYPEEMKIMLERALGIPQWYYLLCALLDAISITGLVLMWNLRKRGFHCYALSKLLLMLLPMIFLGRSFMGIGNIMLGILMIVLYFFQLKSLGTFSNDIQEDKVDE